MGFNGVFVRVEERGTLQAQLLEREFAEAAKLPDGWCMVAQVYQVSKDGQTLPGEYAITGRVLNAAEALELRRILEGK